uniref:Uncharacterized protein n=1 Tax=Anguilla anguilla TaxID=7936 RepID=A0A0E9R9A5_ANGAN
MSCLPGYGGKGSPSCHLTQVAGRKRPREDRTSF